MATRSLAFKTGIAILNRELMKEYGGNRNRTYVNASDAEKAYRRDRGSCRYCGRDLKTTGCGPAGVRFVLAVPILTGGKVEADNILTACHTCKNNYRPMNRIRNRLPNVNSIADLIDRLAVEDHKLAWFENKKREEHAKDTPDIKKIVEWDNLSRDCCELRSMLKREINTAFSEFVKGINYSVVKEARTFRPAPVVEGQNSVADLVDNICMNSAERCFDQPDNPPVDDGRNDKAKEELAETLENIAKTGKYEVLKGT